MIELRWATTDKTTTEQPKLQYRMLFYPVLIGSGDIVLRVCKEGEVEAVWMDVSLAVLPSNK